MLQFFRHFLTPLTSNWIGLLIVLVLASCAAPPPQSPEQGLTFALFEDTGYGLGKEGPKTADAGQGACAVESRYGSSPNSPVSQLICVNRIDSDTERVKYRINYTKPSSGHRIWKITATYPNKKAADFALVARLEAQYGTPRKVTDPLGLTWQKGSTYLELREDQYGVHLQLWDRGLR